MNSETLPKPALKSNWIPDTWARDVFFKLCQQLVGGELIIREGERSFSFGIQANDNLQVEVVVVASEAYRRLFTAGSNGAAEAYMDGLWHTENLTGLIRLLLRNRSQLNQLESGVARVAGMLTRVWHFMNRNTEEGAKKNIAAHYDLGNDFFALFLDTHLMYSSAVFNTGEETLEQASVAKLDRICRKLALTENDHLLEIGTGWGGMAVYAAKNFGCRVTTTTISKEQFKVAKDRVVQQGLENLVTVLLQDYRQLQGRYDKVVSIEMVEAVGHHYLNGYFAKISELLTEDGAALLQAITIDDQNYKAALKEVDFIKRYIFPGSFIPCVNVLTRSASEVGLRLFNLEDIGESYALTLQAWRQRFHTQLGAVRKQGFDDRFIRMWEFYLCYCEGGFRERAISNVQMLFTRPDNRRPQWL